MATNPQQMQAQADMMARMQQGAAQPYMPSSTPGGSAGRGTSNMAMKKGGKVKKMAEGGKTNPKEIFYDNSEPGSSGGYQGTHNIPTGGGEKRGGLMKTKKMAKGGSASSRADGCAVRGKTKA